jgi:hypothetical protein
MYYSDQRAPALYKFDNNSRTVFSKEYEKDFNSYDFDFCRFLKGSIFMFAHKYERGNYVLYASKVSSTDGSTLIPIKEIIRIPLAGKNDYAKFNVSYSQDSASFMVGVNVTKEKATLLHFGIVDSDLQIKSSTQINFTDDNDKKQVENVMVVDGSGYLLVEGNYDYTLAKKKKHQERYLKAYKITKYDLTGKVEYSTQTTLPDKYPLSSQGVISGNSLSFIEFYSDKNETERNMNGFTVSKINFATGKIEKSMSTSVSVADLGLTPTENNGLSSSYGIKHIVNNPQLGGLVILSEVAETSERSYSSISKDPFSGVTTTSGQSVSFLTGAILAISVNDEGQLKWITQLPKSQTESVNSRQPQGFSTSSLLNPWSLYYQLDFPLYSSFAMTTTNMGINLVFNDRAENVVVTSAIWGHKGMAEFQDAETYLVNIDFKSGVVKRNIINLPDESKTILMPKSAVPFSKSIYIASYLKKRLGKGQVVASRIEIQ